MASPSATLVTTPSQATTRKWTNEQRQRLWGWLFISPWIFGFMVFTAFPMLASLIFSFTNFKVGEQITWAGFDNWKLLFSDPLTGESLLVTIRFGLLALPVGILFPLLLASLVNSKVVYGKPLLRVLFYMPFLVPGISAIFIWQSFLNGATGWLNRLLRLIGIAEPPNWLFDTPYVNTALVMIGLWGVGNAMITMLASMQGVPTELYEAARVDGAGPFTTFRRITLPMISPVILYNLVLGAIGLMQYFTVPYVLTGLARSNPNFHFINLHFFQTAFQFANMGYGAAIAWLLFAVGLLITIVIFATSRRWVYYAGGE